MSAALNLGGEANAGALLAEVALLASRAAIGETLTYRIPRALAGQIQVGSTVLVPLGGREQLGYVLQTGADVEAPPPDVDLRAVLAAPRPEPAFDAAMVALLRWVSGQCQCPFGETLGLAVPERQGLQLERRVRLCPGWNGEPPPRLGLLTREALAAIFRALQDAGGELPREELLAAAGVAAGQRALRRARREGWVVEETLLRAPRVQALSVKGLTLTNREPPASLGARQRQVIEYLQALAPGATVAQRDLLAATGASSASVRTLERRGILERRELAIRRPPAAPSGPATVAPTFSPAQAAAAERIEAAIAAEEPAQFLLFGVTGSGKTEIYLRAIERARDRGRTAILLVPEISLTAQVADVVRRRLGERVAILHSALSDGERFDEWERLRRGEADVVVGPRSALFAPLRRPALIILDEEHDGSYKQGGAPRYHARAVAGERARAGKATLVLSSATPSLESFHAAERGEMTRLDLPQRIGGRPLPAVRVLDMRAATRKQTQSVFAPELRQALTERFAAGEQTILFLNRRGFSSFLLCRECGAVPRCPNCAVSLTLHQPRTRSGPSWLQCHHCGHQRPAPTVCAHCGGTRVGRFGIGTQRVEEEVTALLPGVRLARMDADTTRRKGSHQRIVEAMRAGRLDVLVGTQMVTKGFDFPAVTLVGVVAADLALHTPDFRAAERTFQLLAQVSGRAGRGERLGEVLVQTFDPEHYAIQTAAGHDYLGFYRREIQERQELDYPPFGFLARVLASEPTLAGAQGKLEAAAQILRTAAEARDVTLLGPSPAPLERLRKRHRCHLILRSSVPGAVEATLEAAWPKVRRRVSGLALDVHPQDVM